MSELIAATATALVPFVSAGAGAAAGAPGEQLGKDAAEAAASILTRVRRWMHGSEEPDERALVRAIRLALVKKELTKDELRQFLDLAEPEPAPQVSVGKVTNQGKGNRLKGRSGMYNAAVVNITHNEK